MLISSVQRFCVNDGDGIRTTIFFKGCPLNCRWCHNPETKSFHKELLFYASKCIYCHRCEAICNQHVHQFNKEHHINRSQCLICGKCQEICPSAALEINGKVVLEEEIIETILKDEVFYGEKGGVTLSGGEPLSQKDIVDFIKKLKCKKLNINIETCGYFDSEIIHKIVRQVDLFLYDIKDTNESRHLENTGVLPHKILENLKKIDELKGKTRIRCILINGINTEVEHYEKIAKMVKELKHCQGVEFIPYHAYSGSKSTFLGLEDNGNPDWIPTKAQIDEAKHVMKKYKIKVF